MKYRSLEYNTQPIGRLMRNMIISLLINNKKMCISDISDKLNITWPSTDYHVLYLESMGEVKIKYEEGIRSGRKRGLKMVYLA